MNTYAPTGYRLASRRAILIEFESTQAVMAAMLSLEEHPVKGQSELIPAAKTLLLEVEEAALQTEAVREVMGRSFQSSDTPAGKNVSIDAVYDGEDLPEVARLLGLGEDPILARDALIKLHTQTPWQAAFIGFAPGFAYLNGGQEHLNVPRLSSPRTSVPAGAIALAGGFCAIYPRKSPGGWQLIGRTKAKLWDENQEVPALIQPGDRVTFQPTRESLSLPSLSLPRLSLPLHHLEIRDPGIEATIQDLGRPGYAHLGVSRAGAADRTALRRANALVGNPESEACIEFIGGSFRLAARSDQIVAVTGAIVPIEITKPHGGTRRAVTESPLELKDGDRLHIGAPERGLRSYLSVRGGIKATSVLGSCSRDTLAGLGPEPLEEGSPITVKPVVGNSFVGDAGTPLSFLPAADGNVTVLRVSLGPREDWFTPESIEEFFAGEQTVTQRSNRVGLRFQGSRLERARDGELPSEGTVTGALQIPPDGSPVLFLQDHPMTGGYPVLGSVIDEDLWLAGQLPPGAIIRFSRV